MARENPQRAKSTQRRILVIDGQPLVRRGLTSLIGNEPDLTVCAEIDLPRAGLEAISASEPELVIADLFFDGNDPLALVRDIRANYRTLPILVFTTHDASRYAERASRAGANGYVTKQEKGEALLRAIYQLLAGGEYFGFATGAGHDSV